jgi:hypothetical protein
MAIFYELTDCAGVLDPIQTSTDLSGYVDTVITLADGTNHEIKVCRYVNPPQDLDIDLLEIAIYKCFETCEDCLPAPLPPEVPCPRPVDPGYNTGLCDPNIVEDILCSFSEMMYQQMMSKRYKIDYCCLPDEENLIIKHEKIKMKLRESESLAPDPCDPQCLDYGIDILESESAITTYLNCDGEESEIITLPGAGPINVNFCALNTQPPVSVVFSETGDVTHILEPLGPCTIDPPVDNRCLTNTVFYGLGDVGRTTYTNCSGERVFVESDGSTRNPVSVEICVAPNPNYVFTGTEPIITVTDVECVDPPPCVELNYRLTYDSIETHARSFSVIDCEGIKVDQDVQPSGGVFEVCSVEPPDVVGLPPASIVVIGDCAPQLACSIYQIYAGAGGAGSDSMDYIDCQGDAINVPMAGFQVFEVCGIPGQTLSCNGGCKGFESIEIENACG